MGAVDWWRRFVAMPDRDRARLLALVLGGIIAGVLYALGGLSLYLRAGLLTPTPTRLAVTRVGVESPSPPAGIWDSGGGIIEASRMPANLAASQATLYPTVTPDLTRTALGLEPTGPLETPELGTATPFPTPTDSS